jgi:hypothetical protein
MKLLFAVLLSTSSGVVAEPLSPEADACKASSLLALKQKYPQVKDVLIDLDSAKIIKTETKIEDVPIRTVVIGDAYIERTKDLEAANAGVHHRRQGKSPSDALL